MGAMPFTWGDTVRVRSQAPREARPGALAEIVGIRTIDTDPQVVQFGAPLGTQVYVVEFEDGTSVELAEPLLEPFAST